MANSVDCFVYVIARMTDADGASTPVKVGISDDPISRLSNFQTAAPFRLALVKTFRMPSRKIARDVENMFHSTQARHRLYGEWFDIEPRKTCGLIVLGFNVALKTLTDLTLEEREEAMRFLLGEHEVVG